MRGADMEKKLRAGIIGATGYVGQRFVTLLNNHPWFDVTVLAASSRSADKLYGEAVKGRWKLESGIPDYAYGMKVMNTDDLDKIAEMTDFVFCAVDMDKNEIRTLEENIAKTETPVVSNNSAHRWTDDVPVIIPELNPEHADIIEIQKKRLNTNLGFIVAKPNCSIQSFVPALHPLMEFGLEAINVCTYQAISGSGKTFREWPEIVGNMVPYIGGEEEKSENEPLKIWGSIENNSIRKAVLPVISSQCYRVAVQEGHTAAVSVKFKKKPEKDEILNIWQNFRGEPQKRNLPSAPRQFLRYINENDRPQPLIDSSYEKGFGVTIGRLRPDNIFDYKFTCLSHNTVRGAAGGALLTAELMVSLGYIKHK